MWRHNQPHARVFSFSFIHSFTPHPPTDPLTSSFTEFWWVCVCCGAFAVVRVYTIMRFMECSSFSLYSEICICWLTTKLLWCAYKYIFTIHVFKREQIQHHICKCKHTHADKMRVLLCLYSRAPCRSTWFL